MDVLADLDTTWLIVGLLVLALVAFALAFAGWQRSRRRQRDAIPPAFDPKPDLDALGLSTARPMSAPLPTPRSEVDLEPARLDEERDDPADWDDEEDADLDDDLDDDGISAVRPSAVHPVEVSAPHDDDPDELTPELDEEDDNVMDGPEMETDEPVMFDEVGVSAARPVMKAASPSRPRPHPHLAEASPLWAASDPDAVGYLLESLWASIGAQSIALLRHDAEDDVFAVEALVSRDGALHTDPFPARQSALRTLLDDESALAVLEGEALASLRYHTSPRTSTGHAVALPLPGTPGLLLVADGAPGSTLFDDRQIDLVENYADLFGRLFQEVTLDAEAPVAAPTVLDEPPVRTRADIITEEMASARAHERPLALALVVPQNSEDIAAEGPEAVAEAEAQLAARLRAVEGSARVERFGENMMGVFCHAGPAFVEAWAERVGVTGPPVFIGVALLRARHADADALRDAAAAALYEAYESGKTCVILE